MSQPLVWVMIPSFNSSRYLAATIESVLRQTYQAWQLVVVDDASSDGTPDIARAYCAGDPRVQLAVNARNLGLTRNWNKCLSLAQGPLVQLLLSDDLMDPGYLEAVVRAFESHPRVAFVAASCRYIDGDGRLLDPGVEAPERVYAAGDEAVTALVIGGFPHVSSIVMRKAVVDELGPFDENIWHGPDVEMGARLAARFGFLHLGRVWTSFRRHGTNMGVLEYLRDDFLVTDLAKKRKAWGYLSEAGRRRAGIVDLERFLTRDASETALLGAVSTLLLGRRQLAAFYLRRAVRLRPMCIGRLRFWKVLAGLGAPWLVQRMAKRRNVSGAGAQTEVLAVERALLAARRPGGSPG